MIDNNRFITDEWSKSTFVPAEDVGKEGDLKARGRRLEITSAGIVENLLGSIVTMEMGDDFRGIYSVRQMRPVDLANGIFELEYPESLLHYGDLWIQYRIISGGMIYISRKGKMKVEDNPLPSDAVEATSEVKFLDETLKGLANFAGTVDRAMVNSTQIFEQGKQIEDISGRLAPAITTLGKLEEWYVNFITKGKPDSFVIYDKDGAMSTIRDKNGTTPLQIFNRVVLRLSDTYTPGKVIVSDSQGRLIASDINVSSLTSGNSTPTPTPNPTPESDPIGAGPGTDPRTETHIVWNVGDKVRLRTPQPGYYTADDAHNKVNQANSLEPGDYYLYTKPTDYVGLTVNITKNSGVPGSWITSFLNINKL